MTQRKNGNPGSGRGAIDFHADRPMITIPKVHPQPRTIDGVKMYVGIGKENKGKLYIKEMFDRMFKVVRTPWKKGIERRKDRVLLNQF